MYVGHLHLSQYPRKYLDNFWMIWLILNSDQTLINNSFVPFRHKFLQDTHHVQVIITVTSFECHVVSNHRSSDYLFDSLCGPTSKRNTLLALCEGNSPVTGEFPAQRTSNAAKASIWRRHYDGRRYGISIMRIKHNRWILYAPCLLLFHVLVSVCKHGLFSTFRVNSSGVLFSGKPMVSR